MLFLRFLQSVVLYMIFHFFGRLRRPLNIKFRFTVIAIFKISFFERGLYMIHDGLYIKNNTALYTFEQGLFVHLAQHSYLVFTSCDNSPD